ncbi:MAG: TrkA family potassium uptake protein [Cyanobacteria bacterium NC_groundwater_1444_Ag_S-0.65um_54_12]|nr:TrkA family potassium uptake protein [Cyanobacteria bacterium NC_groundwater_1444_Ag_S-0.65um_54_12]
MILIVGCGRLGASFALRVVESGQEVTILDMDRHNMLTYLPKEFKGRTIVGTEIDTEVLRQAGIEEAEVAVIVSRDENTNMMVADVARNIFSHPRVIVRIDHPRLRQLYEEAGFEVLSPTMEATISLERRIAQLRQS